MSRVSLKMKQIIAQIDDKITIKYFKLVTTKIVKAFTYKV